jgi:hypothetical protein
LAAALAGAAFASELVLTSNSSNSALFITVFDRPTHKANKASSKI